MNNSTANNILINVIRKVAGLFYGSQPEKHTDINTSNKKVMVPCRVVLQETDYTCTAACLQMLLKGKGLKVSHDSAIKKIGIQENEGAFLSQVKKAVANNYKRWKLVKIKSPERELDKSNLVLAVTTVNQPQDHVVILKGYERGSYWVADPLVRAAYQKPKRNVHHAARGEFYALTAR